MTTLRTLIQRVDSFFSTPQAPAPLGVFRILMAAFVLIQAFTWYPDWEAFFGREGWIQWEISRALNQAWNIHISQLYDWLHPLGLSERMVVFGHFWIYVISAGCLLVGWHTRLAAIFTWLCHLVIMSSVPTFIYGVDIFLHIALFYLMWMPVAKAFSLDLYQGRVTGEATWGVTMSMRVLQLHMCLAYFSAGYEKMLAPDWWNGNVLWRSLVQPDFRQFNFLWLADYPWVVKLLSWFTMVVETGYCIGMWIPRVRIGWLAGIISLHLGIMLFLGLYYFGLIMILLSISAFGYLAYADWQQWRNAAATKVVPS